jgi:hypothetical protein
LNEKGDDQKPVDDNSDRGGKSKDVRARIDGHKEEEIEFDVANKVRRKVIDICGRSFGQGFGPAVNNCLQNSQDREYGQTSSQSNTPVFDGVMVKSLLKKIHLFPSPLENILTIS